MVHILYGSTETPTGMRGVIKMTEMAKRYAKALHQLCATKANKETLYKETKQFRTWIFGSMELRALIDNPLVPHALFKELIQEICSKAKLSETLLNFLSYVVDQGRFNNIEDIIEAYQNLHHEENNIEKANITTAFDMTKDNQDLFCTFLEKYFDKSLILSFQTNPEIIGGFCITKGSKQIDASLQTQLFNLSRTLKGAS